MDKLPIELFEVIIEHLVPQGGDYALPASDITTRTLHSCLTICKATYNRILELLYSRCLYIDKAWRLRSLLRSYHTDALGLQIKLLSSRSMLLAPFSGETIEEPGVVDGLSALFDILGNYIHRMIIDMPLRTAYPDRREGREIRVPLRNAFRNLMALEEFVSLRDELYLSTIFRAPNDLEPPVWARWPNLQHLALYNVDISGQDLLKNVERLRKLKTLVLTRPDGLEDFETLRDALSPSTTIILVDMFEYNRTIAPQWQSGILKHSRYVTMESDVPETHTGEKARAKSILIGDIGVNGTPVERDISFCEDWIRDSALKGTLWS